MKGVSAAYSMSRSDQLSLQKKLASNSSIRTLLRGDSKDELFRPGLGAELKKLSSFGSMRSFEDCSHNTKVPLEPLEGCEIDEIRACLKDSLICAKKVVKTAKLLPLTHDKSAVSMCDYFKIDEDILLDSIDHSIIPNEEWPSNSDYPIDDWTRAQRILLLQRNIAEIHLEIALLEAYGRFSSASTVRFGSSAQCAGTGGRPDIASCVFHLSEACKRGSCAAALALGRLCYGMGSDISALLSDYIEIDTYAALDYFMLAAYRGSFLGLVKAAEIWDSLGCTENAVVVCRIALQMKLASGSAPTANENQNIMTVDNISVSHKVGDIVEVDWGGCWYSAEVLEVMLMPEQSYRIKYLDGGEIVDVASGGVRSCESSEKSEEFNFAETDMTHAAVDKIISSTDKNDGCGGLVTPLHRISIGGDDDESISVPVLLAELGRLYGKLHDTRGGLALRYIDISSSNEATNEEDIFSWRFPDHVYAKASTCESPDYFYCNDEHDSLESCNDTMLLITAVKYYSAAFEMSLELGMRQAADKYIEEANKIERRLY